MSGGSWQEARRLHEALRTPWSARGAVRRDCEPGMAALVSTFETLSDAVRARALLAPLMADVPGGASAIAGTGPLPQWHQRAVDAQLAAAARADAAAAAAAPASNAAPTAPRPSSTSVSLLRRAQPPRVDVASASAADDGWATQATFRDFAARWMSSYGATGLPNPRAAFGTPEHPTPVGALLLSAVARAPLSPFVASVFGNPDAVPPTVGEEWFGPDPWRAKARAALDGGVAPEWLELYTVPAAAVAAGTALVAEPPKLQPSLAASASAPLASAPAAPFAAWAVSPEGEDAPRQAPEVPAAPMRSWDAPASPTADAAAAVAAAGLRRAAPPAWLVVAPSAPLVASAATAAPTAQAQRNGGATAAASLFAGGTRPAPFALPPPPAMVAAEDDGASVVVTRGGIVRVPPPSAARGSRKRGRDTSDASAASGGGGDAGGGAVVPATTTAASGRATPPVPPQRPATPGGSGGYALRSRPQTPAAQAVSAAGGAQPRSGRAAAKATAAAARGSPSPALSAHAATTATSPSSSSASSTSDDSDDDSSTSSASSSSSSSSSVSSVEDGGSDGGRFRRRGAVAPVREAQHGKAPPQPRGTRGQPPKNATSEAANTAGTVAAVGGRGNGRKASGTATPEPSAKKGTKNSVARTAAAVAAASSYDPARHAVPAALLPLLERLAGSVRAAALIGFERARSRK